MASLCLLDHDGRVAERWELGEEPLAIGRSDFADIKVDDATLSRRHFIIQLRGKDYFVRDLQSQNGTWVDGERAGTVQLKQHGCILAGQSLFMFSSGPASPNPAVLSAAAAQPASAIEHRPVA